MKIAFVGPPSSGKSTLFRAVTGQPAPAHPVVGEHLAVVKVPDQRLHWLFDLYKPKKLVEATIDCLDVPGFSHETAAQQAEFRKTLPSIRLADALVAVVRAFDNPAVPAYRDRVVVNGQTFYVQPAWTGDGLTWTLELGRDERPVWKP